MLAHYNELKKENPDAVILFRCGDFYEAYEDDAETCSKVLGITLTKKNPEGTRMAGFPHHALDNYLPRLIRSAYRVAIADDVPDPNTAKKLVKRGITELIKPGIQMNDYTYVAVLDYCSCTMNYYRIDGDLNEEEAKEALESKHHADDCYYMLSSEPIELYINDQLQ